MRFFSVFLFCFLLAFAVSAQTLDPESDPLNLIRPPQALEPGLHIDESRPLGPQMAKAYFEECMKPGHPGFSEEELQLYCACKAGKIQEELADEEIRVIFEKSIIGQAARDKIAAFITPACVKEPTANMAYRRCVTNKTTKEELKNYKQFCHCLSEGLGGFVADAAAKTADIQLRRKPPPGDISIILIDSYGYTKQHEYFTRRCLGQMEFGPR